MEMRARLVVEGFITGLHKSPYHGFSVEFAEHRQYMPGDEIRRIDWKVLGRTDRYYIKQFEEETNLKSYLVLDTSRSMQFKAEGDVTKLQYASYLAAALAYLLILGCMLAYLNSLRAPAWIWLLATLDLQRL